MRKNHVRWRFQFHLFRSTFWNTGSGHILHFFASCGKTKTPDFAWKSVVYCYLISSKWCHQQSYMNEVMVLLLITWSKSPIRVACSCRRWHRRRTRKRWNACGKRRSAGKEGVCKSKYGKKCRKRQTKIASVHCTLGGKWTLKFHLLQSVSKWIFMFAKEQQGIFSFTRNDSSNSKYLALAGN